ncbi:MAG TPA: B12-binding domain-containing radical SAM protein [bacterium]|nr:B12-binding domain-containing radical SAM protein [bacterium]
MKIRLINPAFPDTFWGFRHVREYGYRYAMANLALPTVAGMTPPEHEVSIQDENVEAIDYSAPADLIGITGFNIQSQRMFEIAAEFRRRGKTVVLGGPYASLCPEECADHADYLIVGEAERIWPQFLRDFAAGVAQPRYVEAEKIDLRTTPAPRWDLIDFKQFGRIPIQTTRGCPFDCEFCDVIVYLGRKVRQKTPAQIAAEIEAVYPHIYRAGRDSVFFADDNFIGNKAHARAVCRMLIELNAKFKRPLRYSTQVTINLAQDKELLELMAEAGFHSVFIGIETPKAENLLEVHKVQNTRRDLLADIRTIQSFGIFVWAGMIVGFDHDDEGVFAEQLQFMQESRIPISMTGMLNAPANTPLWHRLKKEGRLLEGYQYRDQADTNIIPKNMDKEELRAGYVRLMNELYSYENYGERLCGTLAQIQRQPRRRKKAFSVVHSAYNLKRLSRLLGYYLFSSHPERRRYFFKILRQILKSNPAYLKEALWHLALHKHFYEYSRILAEQLEAKPVEQRLSKAG